MKYRAEIDGLRAVAVVPVILFHAGFSTFAGGFVGVDIFFVISGYLITSIIYGEVQKGEFSIVTFYERRFRRIFPALFVMCMACIPFAWMWMLPSEFESFAQSLASVALFASNIHFIGQSGYFSASTELMPLLHTWSLAVEEQFYVVFPLFLLLFRRVRENGVVAILLFVAALSLAGAEWGWRSFPKENFYLFPTRAWELLAGAVLAVTAHRWPKLEGWKGEIVAAAGMALVVYANFVFDKTVPFPSAWGLVPVLGVMIVIVFANQDTLVGKVLSLKPIVGIGLISYSAYLWHQPLFAFARIRLIDGVSPGVYLVLSVAALMLAYLSWRFVETPFRNRKTIGRRKLFTITAAGSAAMIGLGLVGQMHGGWPQRLPPKAIEMADWQGFENPRLDECHAERKNFIQPAEACIYGTGTTADIAILGDSHADALAFELGKALNAEGHNLRELTYTACPPAIGVYRTEMADDCPAYNQAVRDYLATPGAPEMLVVLARWSLYLEGDYFDNRQGGVESTSTLYALPVGKGLDYIRDPGRVDAVGALFRQSIQHMLDTGKRVVLVYPVPEAGWDVPLRLAREEIIGRPEAEALSTSYAVFQDRARNANAQLDLIPDHPNLVRVKPEALLCNSFVPDRCANEANGEPLYADDDHLNTLGAAMLSARIVAAADQRGWLVKAP